MSFIYGQQSAISQIGLTLLAGDTGLVTAGTITLTGSTSGAFFTGAVSTITETINYVALPTTTSSVGQITLNGNRFFHGNGTSNVFLGTNAGNFTNTSINMVGIGVQALQNAVAGGGAGTQNATAIGNNALRGLSASGSNGNVAIGNNSGSQFTGTVQNIFIGDNVCSDAGTGLSTNVAIGLNAMSGSSKTSSVNNNIIGANAGTGITTGTRNLLLGDSAGQDLTTASSSIRLNNVTKGNTGNQLVIGAGTGTGTQQLNESFIHGIRGITTANANAIAVLIDSAGQLGTVSSSIRVKENIEDMGEVSSMIKNLRPVIFDFKYKSNYKKQVGLIAEEVKEVMPNLVVHDLNGEVESVKYHDISIFLLNELKKALLRVEYLESKLN